MFSAKIKNVAFKTKYNFPIIFTLLTALALRLALAKLPSFAGDMWCWDTWSKHIYKEGFGNFYNTIWSDYLPFYLTVLWALRLIYENISAFLDLNNEIIFKLPATLADISFGYIFYQLGKKYKDKTYGFILSNIYLFSPFTYFNSSIWGHIDAFYSLILFCGLVLAKNNLNKNIIFYVAGWTLIGFAFLIKPQTIAFIPLLIFPFNIKRLIYGFIAFFVSIYLVSYPFFQQNKLYVFANLGKLIISSANTYPYISANAMNLWGIFGTWEKDNKPFLWFEAKTWGLVLLTISLCLIYFIYYVAIRKIKSSRQNQQLKETDEITKNKTENKNLQEEQKIYTFFICCCLVAFSLFVLPTRVHERWQFYLFPFLIGALAVKNLSFLWLWYLILSIIHFSNLYFVYVMYYPNFLKIPTLYNFLERNFSTISAANLFIFGILMSYTIIKTYKDSAAKII